MAKHSTNISVVVKTTKHINYNLTPPVKYALDNVNTPQTSNNIKIGYLVITNGQLQLTNKELKENSVKNIIFNLTGPEIKK